MKKITKKFAGEFLMNTKGEGNWNVMSFNAETGRRELWYGGIDFMRAFATMTQQAAQGRKVLLISKDGAKAARDWEWNHDVKGLLTGRVTYDMMIKYAVSISDYDFSMYEPNNH